MGNSKFFFKTMDDKQISFAIDCRLARFECRRSNLVERTSLPECRMLWCVGVFLVRANRIRIWKMKTLRDDYLLRKDEKNGTLAFDCRLADSSTDGMYLC